MNESFHPITVAPPDKVASLAGVVHVACDATHHASPRSAEVTGSADERP